MLLPGVTSAKVIISEVAWMGTESSHNDEWIELYNDGSKNILVDGWVLSDGGTLEILLAGTIGAGEYVVLERTDDGSAPGPAFLIYKGALSNQGKTLSLLRADRSVEDRVEGGDGWGLIGGDNQSKETAQRIEDAWQTAPASPGSLNETLPKELIPEVVTELKSIEVAPRQLAQVPPAGREGNNRLPYFGLIGLLAVAILSLYYRRKEV